MKLASVRGLVLEEVVVHLLSLIGYRQVMPDEEGTRAGHSGLEARGRGEWHQIDGLVAYDRTPPFMYPLRLMVEAKCYSRGRPVGIDVVRNSVGVLKDVSENYFTFRPKKPGAHEVAAPRFNYLSAVFSTSGYTTGAQRYAIAHQIFLIQYDRIALLAPVVDGILGLDSAHWRRSDGESSASVGAQLRKDVRTILRSSDAQQFERLTPEGVQHLRETIVTSLAQVRGSYFGMLQGKWPIHLVARDSLPVAPFNGTDEVRCRVYGRDSDHWSFVPAGSREGDERWFRLEFDIPDEIVDLVDSARQDPARLAQVKQEQFSFLDVAGRIGGVYRQVRLRLDEEWLAGYLDRLRVSR